jgi:predicted O-methyltransferase YrrM
LDKADTILRDIEKKAHNEFLPIVGPEKGQVLAEEIRKAKLKRVLEVGTLIGYSTILMGKELDENAQISVEIHEEEAKKRRGKRAKSGDASKSRSDNWRCNSSHA